MQKKNIKAIAFENESISLKDYNLYRESLGCEFIPINSRLMQIRNVKDDNEIRLLKEANAIAEKSFTELLNHIKPNKTEKELQAFFDYLMLKNGSDGASFSTILLTGSHTSLPHGVPSDRKIQKGDFVLIDFGATCKGYHSDMTRTFAVGSATDEMRERYNLVLMKAKIETDEGSNIQVLTIGPICISIEFQRKGYGKIFSTFSRPRNRH